MRTEPLIYAVGTKVPLLQLKPRLGFSFVVALIQTVVGAAKLCGKTSMLDNWKFLQDELVLHSMMTLSVCARFGSPTLYQHGYIKIS